MKKIYLVFLFFKINNDFHIINKNYFKNLL